MKTFKVSVIVPICNTAEYLHKCICSIQSQSYKNLEIILVNDGSTDNSLDICKRFAKNDERIIIIDKENSGVSSARNAGLDIASGDYIGFVDSDDYIDKDMYKVLIETSIKNDADIVECGINVVNGEHKTGLPFPCKDDIINGNYECSKSLFIGQNTANANCNKLYRRKIFNDIRFPKYSYSEDFWVNAKAFYQCQKKVTIKDKYYFYLQHKKSITNSPFRKEMLESIQTGKEIYKFFQARFENLCPYIALFIVMQIIGLYILLKKTGSKEIGKKYFNLLIHEFKNYHRLVVGEVYKNIKFTKKHIILVLFNFNPDLYYFSHKIYNLIK